VRYARVLRCPFYAGRASSWTCLIRILIDNAPTATTIKKEAETLAREVWSWFTQTCDGVITDFVPILVPDWGAPPTCMRSIIHKKGLEMKRTLIALVLVLSVTGCTVQKTLVPTGGSRADGTVEMSYDFRMFETPQVDYSQGASTARQRCAAWGYSDAAPFGGQKSACQQFNGYGNCVHTLVTVQYQCTGAPPPR